MDFEVTYTAEQEDFRAEVQSWLADYMPEGLENPINASDLSYENIKNCAIWAVGSAPKVGSIRGIRRSMAVAGSVAT